VTLRRAWWSACLPSRVTGVTVGRHLIRQVLHEWDLAPLVPRAELAVCELLSNAVRHAGGRVLTVRMELDDTVLIAVGDEDPTPLPPVDPAARLRDASTGRGLLIVDRIATEWGVTPTEDGKEVWFRLVRGTGSVRSASNPG